MLICIYDNRPESEPAVRLLIASLKEKSPDVSVRLYHNPRSPDFASWIRQFNHIDYRPAEFPDELAYNVKPHVLLHALCDGHENVVWLDSDILVARDFSRVVEKMPSHLLVATEDALWGARNDKNALRTRAWGLAVGRVFPFTLNTCMLRVTPHHREFLLQWLKKLNTAEYRKVQSAPWRSRPAHMSGDQDVFTALICSTEFANVPVHVFRRGRDILQLMYPMGFTTCERIQVLWHGLPFFIHSQGDKPWLPGDCTSVGRDWLRALQAPYGDTSPYTIIAERYRVGKWLHRISGKHPAVAGLPFAMAFDAMYILVLLRRLVRTASGNTTA
jgi:hypothetical protein